MLTRPAHESSGVKADVLSDLLRGVRLTGAVYFDFELSSPWVVAAPAGAWRRKSTNETFPQASAGDFP